jgi:O-antigen/teichoic acid export membrane protein
MNELGSAGILFAGRLARTALQTIGYVLVSRSLGAAGLGTFAAALALVVLLAPFVEVGGRQLAIRDASRGVAPGLAVGNSLAVSSLLLPAGILAAVLLLRVVVPELEVGVAAVLALSVFVGNRLVVAATVFVPLAQPGKTAWADAIVGSLYLGAAGLLLMAERPTVEKWVVLYGLTYGLAGLVSLAIVIRGTGRIHVRLSDLRSRVRLGSEYSLTTAAATASSDVDKTLLRALGDAAATGQYAVATRAVLLVMMPGLAYLAALQPRFFRGGAPDAPPGTMAPFRKPLLYVVAFGVGTGGLIWLAAPLLPVVFGSSFREATEAARWLAAYPLLALSGLLLADVLTGADRQSRRTGSQLAALAANVVLNIVLIPAHGFRGAIAATLAAQLMFLILVASGVYRLRVAEYGGAPR